MKLAEHLRQTGETYTAFGARIGATPQQVGRLAREVRQPSGHLALRIERATDGAVTRHELRPDLYPDADAA